MSDEFGRVCLSDVWLSEVFASEMHGWVCKCWEWVCHNVRECVTCVNLNVCRLR